ncbi:hypothetical protein [Aquaticitalea lipolytica]|uniref:hypothetical protein n=1 Tax=Aquaticitalea lipolytica TaxID=1247562 RepID=UPI0024BA5BA4|nr:hypothetical protein [Aquaticitalea lipolytica]
MAVLLKKNEKIENTVSKLSDKYTFTEFKEKFIELYEKDWKKIEKAYNDHVRNTKEGKKNPMPKPEQYLKNALNVWNNKQ